MRALLIILIFLTTSVSSFATHNRAGEITYEHLFGNTYRITVTTYTKLSAPADREWMPIVYGDGTPADSIQRSVIDDDPGADVRYNVYVKNHTFPGPGTYEIVAEDPNRNIGILNLGDSLSVNLVFTIRTELKISPGTSPNSSVQLLNPPLDEACIFQPYQHNPGAFDPDGDSLSYELVTCLGPDAEPLSVYVDPDQVEPGPNNNISIDPVTGTVLWDAPQLVGLYNIAILITEWRRNNAGEMIVVGTVLRDMQITVEQCGNLPPEIDPVPDYCIEAGENLNFTVSGSDPNDPIVLLSAFGGPFEQDVQPATFNQVLPSTNGTFNWNTHCDHVRLSPYQVTFKVEDNNPQVSLSAYTSANITVVAPAPQNPNATPQLGAIELNWDESPCDGAESYKIYRRAGLYGFDPDDCETGVPAYTGYELLDVIEGIENTTYLDFNDITFGVGYCYMVVACFPDGAESYASEEFCAQIAAEIPLITHNSVGITDNTAGVDTLRWQRPFDLDTLDIFTGPYQYNVYRGDGSNTANELIYTTPESAELYALPGQLIVTDLNTEDQANVYRVELLNAGEVVTSSNPASSVFLAAEPNDEQLTLSWSFNQPWVNFNYFVEKWDEVNEEWNLLGETGDTEFTETGLVNGEEYCYRVIAEGSYFNETFPDTLINYSQELCAQPFDNTPPCPPEFSEDDITCGGCDSETKEVIPNVLTWSNTNDCEDTDDTEVYYIYFAPVEGEELVLIDSVFGADNTTYEHTFENAIAGCYAITALDYDAVNDRRNESDFSTIQCCDFETEYELPNVFTPNNDGKNDVFEPFPYCFVESIDLVVYNRWGQPVFETTDPDIQWDGIHMDSGTQVPDGVYYYICVVNTIRLSGIESFELTGNVHLLNGKENSTNFR